MDSPHSTSAYDHLLKILLIGDLDSNKRELLKMYIGDQDLSDTTTLGLDYKLKDIVYQGKRIKLQLWDTAGQERFRSVTASYYRGSHGALLAFTLKKETSFVSLNYWLEEIKNNAPSRFQVVLVATDTGIEDVEVKLEIARQFAKEKQIPLVECNVEDLTSVEQAFDVVVERIMNSWDDGSSMIESIRLEQQEDRKRSDCFC